MTGTIASHALSMDATIITNRPPAPVSIGEVHYHFHLLPPMSLVSASGMDNSKNLQLLGRGLSSNALISRMSQSSKCTQVSQSGFFIFSLQCLKRSPSRTGHRSKRDPIESPSTQPKMEQIDPLESSPSVSAEVETQHGLGATSDIVFVQCRSSSPSNVFRCALRAIRTTTPAMLPVPRSIEAIVFRTAYPGSWSYR